MTGSYEKFNYLLRPAKQVERKLLVEGLHELSAGGFAIREYRYIGLGSPFYADFVLFHKYLYIDDMVCIERTDIRKRMRFNKPFPRVRLHMGSVSSFIPKIERNQNHIVWVDYDYQLNDDMLADLAGFATSLKPGSILIVTVEADPRMFDDLPDELIDRIRDHRVQTLQGTIGRYVEGGVKPIHLTSRGLPLLYATVMVNRIHDELRIRGLEFYQLFNFVYADGRQMLSVGGMIGDRTTNQKLHACGVYNLPFVTEGPEPISIWAPPLTTRERLWLDQNPKSPRENFEVKPDVVKYYRRYYRYYPAYFEALL